MPGVRVSRQVGSVSTAPHGYRCRLLPYTARLASRPAGDIDLVVIHCTELPDLTMARDFAERIHYPSNATGNSGHYYIDRDGMVELWVTTDRIAQHTRGYNERSIGVELINTGRFPDWLHSGSQEMTEPYQEPQIEALLILLDDLQEAYGSLKWIAGHEDLDRERVPASDQPGTEVYRKRDPGSLFPWDRVLAAARVSPWPKTRG